ncbi:MAG: hypothetical protein R6V55_14050 [Desulfovermiculus sp.]
MAKREKILVGLMVIALAYAAFELIYFLVDDSSPTRKEAQVEPGQAHELAARTSQALEQVEMEEVQRHVLEAAADQWSQSPFAPKPESLSEDKEQASDADTEKEQEDLPEFNYTGYLEMGQTRMAVINGLEYQVGEKLEQENYVLVSIQPEMVILQSLDSGAEITVSYQGKSF